MNLKSGFLQEFFERGYLAQCTDISSLDDIFLQQKITAYIGFDCTAKSLHVGSLIQIMILRLLQKHNHKTIILLGGGTTKIGDPSGKDDARQILDSNKINENLTGIHKTLQKFINFQENKAILINNDNWLKDLNYVEFLRKVGKHFSVNKMLNFDSVKLRLEREQPLSFLEFNYMILQAFDFYELHKNHDCILQIGGSDQWGNIVNGVELIRKLGFENGLSAKKSEAFGLTSPLLTTFDGKKMGKTAEGAVWLDEAMLSPFDYFQYFRNTHDNDVIKFLKLFTDLTLEEIKKFENLNGQEIHKSKEVLAFEATKICHGEEIANQILLKARGIFLQKNSENFEEKIITIEENNSKKLVEIIFEIKATESKADAKRLIEGNAVKINNQIINDINFSITTKNAFELSIGKKKFFKIIVK
jgi:tyrosyl-tRNA synthetase